MNKMQNKAAIYPSWWSDSERLRRFLVDNIVAELKQLRPGTLHLPALPWPVNLNLVNDLGVDSMELLSLATAVSSSLQVHHSGLEDQYLQRSGLQDWEDILKESLQHSAEKIAFSTSGSTGVPKVCLHELADLQREIAELLPLFANVKRLFFTVSSHHIYGFLFSVMLPSLMPGDIELIDARSNMPSSLACKLRSGDVIIAYPDFWHAMMDSGAEIPAGVTGVTSTAPCPDSIANGLVQQGLDTLIQVYGSTETAGIGWRIDASHTFCCLSYWRRANGSDSHLVRTDRNENAHRVSVPDHLEWLDDTHFLPVSRIDHAVQVGGINVFPLKVSGVLLRHQLVKDAIVRMMRPDEGRRLKAFLVPVNPSIPHAELVQQVRQWARRHLTTAELPASFTVGTSLPRASNGKLRDWISEQAD